MSIRCERYIGYSLDIMKDIETLKADVYEIKCKNKDIVILYDGLDGRYCKLFYVIAKDIDNFYDEHEVDKILNEMLKTISVNMEVKQEMREAYKEIFGKELEHASLIKAEYILHYC